MNRSPFKFGNILGHEDVSSSTVLAAASQGDQVIVAFLSGSSIGLQAANAKLKLKDRLVFKCGWAMNGAYKIDGAFEMIRSEAPTMGQNYGIIINREAQVVMPGSQYTYVMLPAELDHPFNDPVTVQIMGQRLTQIVSVGILPEWYTALVTEGRNHRDLISKISCFGCNVYAIRNYGEGWTQLVSDLLKSGKISFPAKSAA
jgi:hypothetical protein